MSLQVTIKHSALLFASVLFKCRMCRPRIDSKIFPCKLAVQIYSYSYSCLKGNVHKVTIHIYLMEINVKCVIYASIDDDMGHMSNQTVVIPPEILTEEFINSEYRRKRVTLIKWLGEQYPDWETLEIDGII